MTSVLRPSRIGVPQSISRPATTRSPPTRVPLAEPSSYTVGRVPSTIRACRCETRGSVSRSVHDGPRPRVSELPRTCSRWPRSGPSVTRRTARGRAELEARVSQDAGAMTTSRRSPVRRPHSETSRSAGHGWAPSTGTRSRCGWSGATCCPMARARSATVASPRACTPTSTEGSPVSAGVRSDSVQFCMGAPGLGRRWWWRRRRPPRVPSAAVEDLMEPSVRSRRSPAPGPALLISVENSCSDWVTRWSIVT